MKIIFICRGNLKTNASTIRAINLSRFLKKNGFDVHLLMNDDPMNYGLKEQQDHSFTFHFVKRGWVELFRRIQHINKGKYNVVHILNLGLKSFVPAFISKYFFGKKFTMIWDADEDIKLIASSTIKKHWLTALEKLALSTVDIMLIASSLLMNDLKIRTSRPVYHFPYAVDTEKLHFSKQDITQFKEKYSGKKIITYLGSFQPYFQIHLIPKVAYKLNSKFQDLLFLFIGSGPLLPEIKEQCINLGVNNVEFTGFASDNDVYKYLSISNVFIFPFADTEINRYRCPNKINLFMAAQKPIVTNAVGEVYSQLQSAGYYFNIDSIDSFYEQITNALSAGKITYPNLHKIDWAFRAKEYVHIVEELL